MSVDAVGGCHACSRMLSCVEFDAKIQTKQRNSVSCSSLLPGVSTFKHMAVVWPSLPQLLLTQIVVVGRSCDNGGIQTL